MRQPLSQIELRTILHEAEVATRRLVRRLCLPEVDVDDVRQDLLVDLLSRLRAFDATRGTLGGFAGLIMANRATRLARRIRKYRRLFDSAVSLDAPAGDFEDEPLGARIAEEQGIAAVLGHWQNPAVAVERCLDFQRLVG